MFYHSHAVNDDEHMYTIINKTDLIKPEINKFSETVRCTKFRGS